VRHFKVLEGQRAFAESDRIVALPEIRQFIIDNLRSFVADVKRMGGKYSLPENQQTVDYIMERTDAKNYEWDDEWTNRVISLWNDPTTKKIWNTKRNEFSIDDAAPYFFENATKFTSKVYAAAQEDLLRFCLKGHEVVNAKLTIDGVETVLLETSAKRNYMLEENQNVEERLDVMLYVISLSEYDLKSDNEASVTKMMESLELFEQAMQSPYLLGCSIILVFNKVDIFRDKIGRKDLWATFPEYNGGNDYESALQFVTEQFMKRNSGCVIKKLLYTSAIDSEFVSSTWAEIKQVIHEKGKKKALKLM
jgi:guanine nucleotide-binding protein G(i) subunit alpha